MNLLEKIKELIKEIINKIFKKREIKLLDKPQETTLEEIPNKEEFLIVYKNIKDKNVELANLTKKELIMFITIAKQELNFLNKKIVDELTQYDIPKKEFELYKQEFERISEASITEIFANEEVNKVNNVSSNNVSSNNTSSNNTSSNNTSSNNTSSNNDSSNNASSNNISNNRIVNSNKDNNVLIRENKVDKEEMGENNNFIELGKEEILQIAENLKLEIEEKNKELIKNIENKLILQEKVKKLQEIINEFTKRKNEYENA